MQRICYHNNNISGHQLNLIAYLQTVKSKLNTAGTQVGGALPSAAFHKNPVDASNEDDSGKEVQGNTSEDKQNRNAENTRQAGEAVGENAQKKLDNKVYHHLHKRRFMWGPYRSKQGRGFSALSEPS